VSGASTIDARGRVARAPGRSWPARLARDPMTCAGAVLVAAFVAAAFLAPWLATHDPNAPDLAARLARPGSAHWLGTDSLGRDLYSRLVHGARPTLLVVALVIALAVPVGVGIGLVAGFRGGVVDAVLMRVTDVVMAFPRLIVALALVAVLRPGLESAVVAIALTAWPPYARLARAEALALRRTEFVEAARSVGMGEGRIILAEILPLCLTSVAIRATLDMAGIILTAAGLGFLGLGAQPPLAEWGAMIAAGRDHVFDAWWVAAIPGLAIVAVSLGFNLLGDGLRDLLDPRQRT
jgi:peptide/nickel transport system permease protein